MRGNVGLRRLLFKDHERCKVEVVPNSPFFMLFELIK